ncbi:MAG: hypothetical protein LGR52_09885 [Candidatus Thiosymbion ectosymbiont of Robbea hypermnestra]|nr:hypothetical protein [Candidatus Thiosymbion ectosymbiont of Robbea hypermnestra]
MRIAPVCQGQRQERLGERFREIDIYATLEDNERADYQRDDPGKAETMSRLAEDRLDELLH